MNLSRRDFLNLVLGAAAVAAVPVSVLDFDKTSTIHLPDDFDVSDWHFYVISGNMFYIDGCLVTSLPADILDPIKAHYDLVKSLVPNPSRSEAHTVSWWSRDSNNTTRRELSGMSVYYEPPSKHDLDLLRIA